MERCTKPTMKKKRTDPDFKRHIRSTPLPKSGWLQIFSHQRFHFLAKHKHFCQHISTRVIIIIKSYSSLFKQLTRCFTLKNSCMESHRCRMLPSYLIPGASCATQGAVLVQHFVVAFSRHCEAVELRHYQSRCWHVIDLGSFQVEYRDLSVSIEKRHMGVGVLSSSVCYSSQTEQTSQYIALLRTTPFLSTTALMASHVLRRRWSPKVCS